MAEDEGKPVPNKADAAWAELQALRARAWALNIEVGDDWPIVRLREEIARREAERG